jgi:hypothetical protein
VKRPAREKCNKTVKLKAITGGNKLKKKIFGG